MQDLIPVLDVINGLVYLEDGRIVKLVEIIPINFTESSARTKDNIADKFGVSFRRLPDNIQIKCMSTSFDLAPFIRKIREATADEQDGRLLKRIDDYILHAKKLQKKGVTNTRFFLIYDYTGDDKGRRSDKVEDIETVMNQHLYQVFSIFNEMGFKVYTLTHSPYETCEMLYQFYNPSSSRTEPFEARYQKASDACRWAADEDESKPLTIKNLIAPRGIRFGKFDYVCIDGIYETFYVLKDNAYPTNTYLAWPTQIFNSIENGDMDIFIRKSTASYNSFMLDRVNVLSNAMVINRNGDTDKQEEYHNKAANAKYLKTLLDQNGEDLYDVCILFTLRANSLPELRNTQVNFLKKMKGLQYKFENCFMRTQLFFNSVSPYNDPDDVVFSSNKRNFTNTSLASLFCFTTFSSFDPNGYMMGISAKSGTLFAFDNFDTKKYPNPHIFIVGTTGAGKSFTELMLTGRMRMKGVRTMFILPLKGHEYKPAVQSLGGEFISLRPGDRANCINICEIRPEGRFDASAVDEDDAKDIGGGVPMMAKKINSIIGFISILLGNEHMNILERSKLSSCLVNMYAKYGISNDNDSIWEDKRHGVLKRMPVLGDLYEQVSHTQGLDRIEAVLQDWVGNGNCSNMNHPTNVNLDNKCIAFDVNEDNIGEELLPAFMYIAFDLCYDMAKADEYEFCSIALDEVWKMLQIPDCAKQIFKMIKILRGYGACAITATQDIEDCASNEYGRSLISLSAIHIYLKMNAAELKALGGTVKLSPENQTYIQQIHTGTGFVCANTDVQMVQFIASEWEGLLYETDTKKKREKKEKLQKTRKDLQSVL